MTKNEFLAFLDGVLTTFQGTHSDPWKEIVEQIKEKAEELEEPVKSVPSTPINPYDKPFNPWEPTIWWSKEELNDHQIVLPDPNDWSIEVDASGSPNFKVVK